MGAGLQNIGGGIKTISDVAMYGGFDNLFGGNKGLGQAVGNQWGSLDYDAPPVRGSGQAPITSPNPNSGLGSLIDERGYNPYSSNPFGR